MNLLTRALPIEPSTYNPADLTVDVVFSTGADVQRYDLEGAYIERLSMDPAHVDLSQLIGGPVLDNHDRASGVRAILGVVRSASVDGARGIAKVQFSSRPEVSGIAQDVQAGIIRSVSAGYSVQQWQTATLPDGRRLRTAVKWRPVEVSLTPLAADPQAKVRSKEESPMPDNETQIRTIAETVGLPAEFADGLINRSLSLEDARTEIVHEAARRAPRISSRPPATVTPNAEPEEMTRAAADALYHRIEPSYKPSEAARMFMGRRMSDVARELLRLRGLSALGSDAEIVTRSLHSTSDFPNLLSNIANKSLAAQYQVAPSGMKTVCRRGPSHNDFKGRNTLRRGELPTLLKVNENGEFKRGTTTEAKEFFKVDTFGRVWGMTRQTIVNDDLSAFGDIVSGWGMAAMEFENGFLVDILTSGSGNGPTLGDTKALFHADHANKAASGGAISETTLSAARLAMRLQKGVNGTTPINVTPRYLLIPAALETTAEKQLSALYPAETANVNPFGGSNRLEIVVDPRLDAKSATRWYIFADPAVLPCVEYAYLSGFEGVQIESRAGFDVDGVEIRARIDYGAGGVDFRGAYVNAGA